MLLLVFCHFFKVLAILCICCPFTFSSRYFLLFHFYHFQNVNLSSVSLFLWYSGYLLTYTHTVKGKLNGWNRQDKRFAIKKSHSTHNCVLRESEKHSRTRMSFSTREKIRQTCFAPFMRDVWFSFSYSLAWMSFSQYTFYYT